jgi:hypothetical protein
MAAKGCAARDHRLRAARSTEVLHWRATCPERLAFPPAVAFRYLATLLRSRELRVGCGDWFHSALQQAKFVELSES